MCPAKNKTLPSAQKSLISFVFLFLFIFQMFSLEGADKQLKINLFCKANGAGMGVDQKILVDSLETFGCSVHLHDKSKEKLPPKADINIFVEILQSNCMKTAPLNWFIPNPEWYKQPLPLLDKIDLILCRTREVERIFQERGSNTYYLGFTTFDHYNPEIQKLYDRFIHVAGRSQQKGTPAILDAWSQNPTFPELLVIKREGRQDRPKLKNLTWYRLLDEETLRQYQNEYGIHLCLSETEGFGHYLAEAMAVGAVVITTDAPPMNEFITDPRCLVPYSHTAPQHLGINYYVDAEAVATKIEEILQLSEEELAQIGLDNRAAYIRMKNDFMERLANLLQSISL